MTLGSRGSFLQILQIVVADKLFATFANFPFGLRGPGGQSAPDGPRHPDGPCGPSGPGGPGGPGCPRVLDDPGGPLDPGGPGGLDGYLVQVVHVVQVI